MRARARVTRLVPSWKSATPSFTSSVALFRHQRGRDRRKSRSATGVVTARKQFGQHFLEPVWVTKLVNAIAPQPGEPFVEIGPGRGAITWPFVRQSGRVLAIEVDRDLAAAMRARETPGTVREGDVLETAAGASSSWQGAAARPRASCCRWSGTCHTTSPRSSCSCCCASSQTAGLDRVAHAAAGGRRPAARDGGDEGVPRRRSDRAPRSRSNCPVAAGRIPQVSSSVIRLPSSPRSTSGRGTLHTLSCGHRGERPPATR